MRVSDSGSIGEFLSFYDGVDDIDDELELLCRRVTRASDRLAIELDIMMGEHKVSSWLIECIEVVEERLSFRPRWNVTVERNHPLLLDYQHRSADVYFYSAAADPLQVVGVLMGAHEDLMQCWRPMSRYLNSGFALRELLAQPSGLLAKGPVCLMEAYAEALEACGVSASTLDNGLPKQWDSEKGWVEIPECELLLLSAARSVSTAALQEDAASYVIARGFAARNIDS